MDYRDVLQQGYAGPQIYQIGNFAFELYQDPDSGEKLYAKDDCFVQQINPDYYRRDITRMDNQAGAEMPYFWGNTFEPLFGLRHHVTFGLFTCAPSTTAQSVQHKGINALRLDGYAEAVVGERRPEKMYLHGAYIEQRLRGKNLSKLLYQARVDWALNSATVTKVLTCPCEANIKSRKAAEGFGFTLQPEKTRMRQWGENGELAGNILYYSLDLQKHQNINSMAA